MLTETQLRNVKTLRRPRKLSDGGGLYLLIAPTGALLALHLAIHCLTVFVEAGLAGVGNRFQ